jgi:dipeptidyl-peptidase 4
MDHLQSSPTSRITIEDIATYPSPGNTAPVELSFSPDDRLITFLHSPENSLVRQLFQFDPQTTEQRLFLTPTASITSEENLSLEEKLRRERQRQLGLGVTSYAWADKGSGVLVPLQDGLYVIDVPGAEPRRVASNQDGALLDPQFSPDGEWIAYVQHNELFCVPAAGGEIRQLTFSVQGNGRSHGLAEFIAQEEMGRSRGFWWSPDGKLLAFEEVDETHMPVYRIMHQGKDTVGEGAQEDHRYPYAGQDDARVRLGVVPCSGGDVVWMDLSPTVSKSGQNITLSRLRSERLAVTR